jgi:hypothetical protein
MVSTVLDNDVSRTRRDRMNAMQLGTLTVIALALAACSASESELTTTEKDAIRGQVERTLQEAYDLGKPKAAERMISLYPASGRVVSANGGRASASRDSLVASIRYFWDNVGVNMRDPQWIWDQVYVDVLSRNAAVVTATYHIPHRNPNNQPHVLGGAMTVVFQRREGRWVIVQEHLSDLPQGQAVQNTMPTHDHH